MTTTYVSLTQPFGDPVGPVPNNTVLRPMIVRGTTNNRHMIILTSTTLTGYLCVEAAAGRHTLMHMSQGDTRNWQFCRYLGADEYVAFSGEPPF